MRITIGRAEGSAAQQLNIMGDFTLQPVNTGLDLQYLLSFSYKVVNTGQQT